MDFSAKHKQEKVESFGIDRKTGRYVLLSPPSAEAFEWRDGFVLRALTSEESNNPEDKTKIQLFRADPYEWVPMNEVEVQALGSKPNRT